MGRDLIIFKSRHCKMHPNNGGRQGCKRRGLLSEGHTQIVETCTPKEETGAETVTLDSCDIRRYWRRQFRSAIVRQRLNRSYVQSTVVAMEERTFEDALKLSKLHESLNRHMERV
jgi:hypothetical protein